jgi:arabinogalactan oligomer/maltooligosaccharide transport system permease protein
MARRSREELPHPPLHAILVFATIVTVYPILWVLTIALSGKQSLAIADLPAQPTVSDRIRAVIPWPETVSLANFKSVMTDQPFARWLLNSAIVSAATTLLGIFLAATAGYAFSRSGSPAAGRV